MTLPRFIVAVEHDVDRLEEENEDDGGYEEILLAACFSALIGLVLQDHIQLLSKSNKGILDPRFTEIE